MLTSLRLSGEQSAPWRLHAGLRCSAPGRRVFADVPAARGWLGPMRHDPGTMQWFRTLAIEHDLGHSLWRLSDEQLLDRLAVALHTGVLHVHYPESPRSAVVDAPAPAAPPAPRPARAASTTDAPTTAPAAVRNTPATEPATFSETTDAAATAAVLQAAAVDGTPFCEECAKPARPRAVA